MLNPKSMLETRARGVIVGTQLTVRTRAGEDHRHARDIPPLIAVLDWH